MIRVYVLALAALLTLRRATRPYGLTLAVVTLASSI